MSTTWFFFHHWHHTNPQENVPSSDPRGMARVASTRSRFFVKMRWKVIFGPMKQSASEVFIDADVNGWVDDSAFSIDEWRPISHRCEIPLLWSCAYIYKYIKDRNLEVVQVCLRGASGYSSVRTIRTNVTEGWVGQTFLLMSLLMSFWMHLHISPRDALPLWVRIAYVMNGIDSMPLATCYDVISTQRQSRGLPLYYYLATTDCPMALQSLLFDVWRKYLSSQPLPALKFPRPFLTFQIVCSTCRLFVGVVSSWLFTSFSCFSSIAAGEFLLSTTSGNYLGSWISDVLPREEIHWIMRKIVEMALGDAKKLFRLSVTTQRTIQFTPFSPATPQRSI